MHPKTQARRGALKALVALENSDVPLASALNDLHLPAEAQGFARELVAGVCRTQSRLDHTIAPLLKKRLSKLDAPVRAALRLAAYERCVLDTPHSALVDEYAEAMRAAHLRSAVGFVNAVARRLPAEFIPSPDANKNAVAFLSTEYSHPTWIVERWLRHLGFEACAALCQSNNTIAPLHLRVNTLKTTRERVLDSLRERGLDARAGALSIDAVVVERGEESLGSPQHWPEWQSGWILAQDEAAQCVARLAHPHEGDTIVDACAAPGGKTTHLAQMMKDTGTVLACDLAPGRLKLVRENAQHLGLKCIETRAGDFLELASNLPKADLVLLDAPCLGTGTWRRRPDARWRKTKQQLGELVVLQRKLLNAAALVVKPGGVLVYSTCSLESEENEDQAHWFLEQHDSWSFATSEMEEPLRVLKSLDGVLQTWPHLHDCDGMFAAKFQRQQ
ncbi:MAG TPA: 16S rRNA (cytosine(967)-C(5))-methyltransferase RsmB [Abditibacteriaceae bacterium]|jgi:16S rRNA (cytosine967-C5)-methyltransferase